MNEYFRFIHVGSFYLSLPSVRHLGATARVLLALTFVGVIALSAIGGASAGMEGPDLAALRDSLEGSWTDPAEDSCYVRYPDSLLTSQFFKKVFELYVSDGVLNGTTSSGWSEAQFDSFATAIFDSDSTTSIDIFPKIWNYFCYGDQAAAEDSVNYDNGIDKIKLSVYHGWNFVRYPLSSYGDYGVDHFYCDTLVTGSSESKMHGRAVIDALLMPASGTTQSSCGFNRDHDLRSATFPAHSGVFAHELQHLITGANTGGIQGQDRGEFRATAAEFVGGVRWANPAFRIMYEVNSGIYGGDSGDYAPYNLFRLLNCYLFAHFSADSTSQTDDLIYKAERGSDPGTFRGFAEILGDEFSALFPSMTDSDIAQTVYLRFALARFADDTTGVAGGVYGFGDTGVSPRNFGWFEWLASSCAKRVNWVPPDVSISVEALTEPPATVSTWTDTVDTVCVNCTRDLELHTYGSEYFLVRADSSLNTTPKPLSLRIQGLDPVPASHAIKIGYLEYESAEGPLYDQDVRAVTESIPITLTNGYLDTSIEIEDFGDSTSAAVLVVSLVESVLSSEWHSSTMPISITYDLRPDTTRVPSDELAIQDAINGISVGGVVLVNGQTFEYEEAITLKSGVRLVGVDGGNGLPVINGGGASTVVEFPEDADAYTAIEGFVIKGGSDQVVRLRGAGTIEDCSLDGTSTDPTYGVRSDTTDAGAKVNNCSILLDSGTGILINGGAVAVSDCDVRVIDGSSGNTGIETSASGGAGSYSMVRNFVRVPSGTGIVGAATGTSISQCTVDSVDVGFNVSAGSIDRCIASAFSSSGFLGNAATNSIADDSGSSPFGSGDVAKGSGSVVEDPLYCDRGAGEFTRRIDGYAALSDHAGAFPATCAYGEMVRAVTLSTPDTTEVTGDLVLAYNLHAKGGAVLRMAPNDDAYDIGSDAARVEIIVNGAVNLKAGDTNADGAVFMGSSSSEDAWAGIRSPEDGTVNQSGTVTLRNSVIRNAVVGVRLDSVSTKSIIEGCTFADNQSRDVLAYIENTQSSMLDVVDCAFTVGGGTGIELVGDSETVVIDGCTFTGSASSSQGILLSSGSGAPHIEDCTGSGFSAGTPLKIQGGSAIVKSNLFQNSKYGIHVSASSASAPVVGASGEGNEFSGNTNGVRLDNTGSQAVLRYNYIHSNTHGVVTAQNANPDLGTGSEDGNNSIVNNTTYCIWNRNSTQGVTAAGNWFGSCSTPTCANGAVVMLSYLCSSPLSMREPDVALVEAAPPFALRGFYPNPMQGSGQFVFELGEPAEEVRVELFDVAGRRIRTLTIVAVGSGRRSVFWDGTDQFGARVASGIYLARSSADGENHRTNKVLVVR